MGGHVHDDDGPVGLPSQDLKTDFGDGGVEGKLRLMGVGLGVCGAGGDRYLENWGVSVEVVANNCGLCRRKDNLQDVYRGGEDGIIQKVPQVGGPRTRPHTGGE